MKVDLFSIGPVTIHGYGLMIWIGVLCCVYMGTVRAKKYGLIEDAVLDIAMIGLVAGFVGAKLLYILVEWRTFLKAPLDVLLWGYGWVVYGGISAGVVSAIIYCKIRRYRFLEYFDLVAPCISLAQAFGRIGCFLAGCCYGRETQSFLGVVFPEGALAPVGVSLLPTQLFSSAGNFVIMFVLLWHYKHRKRSGDTGFLYMLLYGVGRFGIEFLRDDSRGEVGIFSTSQFISLFIVTAAILLLLWKGRLSIAEIEAEKAAALQESDTQDGEKVL